MSQKRWVVGVDVGGTFTDLLLFDTQSGAFWRHKTPSTPHDSSEGILNGVSAICASANSLMTMSMTPWVRSYIVASSSSSSGAAFRSHWYFQSRFNRRFQCSSRGNLSQRMLPNPETRRAARNVR